jgi:flavin reductase (DIM6/NTAB) family NADH-FMN oxidoreductase RutF
VSGSAEPDPPAIDPAHYRQVLGHYPTGVVLVTGLDGGHPVGLSIGSFTSLSLDPPLVLFCVDKLSRSWARIDSTGRFCVNVLTEDEELVARRFAEPGTDRFDGIGWRPAASGSPIVDGVSAWIDCAVKRVDDGGDHWVVIARVTDLDVEHEGPPLVFYRGGYGRYRP